MNKLKLAAILASLICTLCDMVSAQSATHAEITYRGVTLPAVLLRYEGGHWLSISGSDPLPVTLTPWRAPWSFGRGVDGVRVERRRHPDDEVPTLRILPRSTGASPVEFIDGPVWPRSPGVRVEVGGIEHLAGVPKMPAWRGAR
jgi:hypothetical protein